MTPQGREQLRAELVSLVQRRRADYLLLKGAGREITRGELSEAVAAYERALMLLSRFFEHARGDPTRRDNDLEKEKRTLPAHGEITT